MDIIDYSKSINRFDLVEMLTPDAETIRRLNEAIEKRNRAVEALKLTIKEARKQIEQINKILSED